LFGATINARIKLENLDKPEKYGLIFGSESHGISPELLKIINKKYKISGFSNSDSLNVAIAVGISLYHFTLKEE
jgi:TrmH family RNA methyltransferase